VSFLPTRSPGDSTLSDPRFRHLAGAGEPDPDVQRRLGQPVVIRVPGQATWAQQVAAICLVDLLGRLVLDIRLDVDDNHVAHRLLPPGEPTLAERLERARHHALISPESTTADPVLTVVVGGSGDGDIFIDGSGWLSYLGQTPGALQGRDETNPIGPVAAACRGASQVIQRLLGERLPATTPVAASYWSALTLGPVDGPDGDNPPLDNPVIEALLMGAGSIGGAASYAFARVPGLAGKLIIVDPQCLEERNSLKALLARRDDIQTAARKIDVAKAELAHLSDLHVDPVEGTLAQFVAAQPADRPLPLSLCAVDSIPARRELADHMPLDAVNAACADTHIVISGHRTDDGPCIYCLYIPQILDQRATRARMIHKETGLVPGLIDQYRVKRVGLPLPVLDQIARHRGMPPGSLHHREGMTLDELFTEEFLYGEVRLKTADGAPADTIQLTFVPALVGVLLAGEALKAGSPGLDHHRLGPSHADGPTEYAESLLHAPVGMHTPIRRWPTTECLCNSVRRLRLMRERYGL
jgi:hypothetical protein